MTAAVALADLGRAGVTAWVESGRLRLRGRQPPASLLDQVRHHRDEIARLLVEQVEIEARAAFYAEAAEEAFHAFVTSAPDQALHEERCAIAAENRGEIQTQEPDGVDWSQVDEWIRRSIHG